MTVDEDSDRNLDLFQGIQASTAKKNLYFCDFPGGIRTPCRPSGSMLVLIILSFWSLKADINEISNV